MQHVPIVLADFSSGDLFFNAMDGQGSHREKVTCTAAHVYIILLLLLFPFNGRPAASPWILKWVIAGQVSFLSPNYQCQNTEGKTVH